MKLAELMRIVVREFDIYDNLEFDIHYENVAIKMGAGRYSFTESIFAHLLKVCVENNLHFYLHDDVIYVYFQN